MAATVIAPQVGFHVSHLALETSHAHQFIDITDEILDLVRTSGLTNGLAVVASQHTTACILVNEHEPELLKDLSRLMLELAPEERNYAHNDVPCGEQERPNGHAHCQALLLSASASLPIAGGRLLLGRYQRVFLVELDCPRPRQVTIVLLGS
jgi:secondary thiamine-phosphate synthase enzyme